MSEWILTKDKFPDPFEPVLIYSRSMAVIGAYLTSDNENKPICWTINDWDESDEILRLDVVTHWMPVPAPPKEG